MASATGTVDEKEASEQLEIIRKNHDEAYLYVSQGLSYQEQNQFNLACEMYKKGLEKIDIALNVRCDRPHCVGPKWDNARKLQQKMRKTAQMIRGQVHSLPNEVETPPYTSPEPFEMPPSYDEACQHELIAAARRSSCPETNKTANGVRKSSTEVVELFCVPDEVQLFFVSHDGSVSTSGAQTSLYIYQFVDHEVVSINVRAPAWLQVGSWTYPLIPGRSPALESAYGAFLFPDIGAGRDSAVGVILPPTVDAKERQHFQELLHRLTALREEYADEPPLQFPDGAKVKYSETSGGESYGDVLARGIVTGAEYLSAGLVKGATFGSELIHKGARKVKQNIQPEAQPVPVDPRVRDGLKVVREVSGVALTATSFLVRKLGDLTVAVGRYLAPHIREQSTKLISSTFHKNPSEAQSTVDGLMTFAASSFQGFATVYMALEHSARTLAYSLSSETVNIVDHKYGNEVGEVIGSAVSSIGNLALTGHNVKSLGVKSVAKRTAKDTGKAVLKDYIENAKQSEE